jgi:hypothetical protein
MATERYEITLPLEEGEAAKAVMTVLSHQGYALESGDMLEGKYGKGNKILRLLFGAFVKRFVFKVTISGSEKKEKSTIVIEKDTFSQISGGLIGMNQYDSEMKRIAELLQALA